MDVAIERGADLVGKYEGTHVWLLPFSQWIIRQGLQAEVWVDEGWWEVWGKGGGIKLLT